MTELILQDDCKALVYTWDDIDQQEKDMIVEFANKIAHHLALSNSPAFVLDFKEYNGKTKRTTLRIRIFKADIGGACILGVMPKMLFQTTFMQKYHAKNHDNSAENYNGTISGSVVIDGAWDEEKKCSVPHEFNEVALEIACGIYYKCILKHYPEWVTRYVDSPILVTSPIDHV